MSFVHLRPGLALVPVLAAGLCLPAYAGLKEAPSLPIINNSGRPLRLVLVMVGKGGRVGASRPQAPAGAGAGLESPEAGTPVELFVDEPEPGDLNFQPILGDFDLGSYETIRLHLDPAEGQKSCQARFLLMDWQETPMATFAVRIEPEKEPRFELLAVRPGEAIGGDPDRLTIGISSVRRFSAHGPAASAARAESKAESKAETKAETKRNARGGLAAAGGNVVFVPAARSGRPRQGSDPGPGIKRVPVNLEFMVNNESGETWSLLPIQRDTVVRPFVVKPGVKRTMTDPSQFEIFQGESFRIVQPDGSLDGPLNLRQGSYVLVDGGASRQITLTWDQERDSWGNRRLLMTGFVDRRGRAGFQAPLESVAILKGQILTLLDPKGQASAGDGKAASQSGAGETKVDSSAGAGAGGWRPPRLVLPSPAKRTS